MSNICVVGESGGMRNAYGSGYLCGTGIGSFPVASVLAVSSASNMLAYHFAGQGELTFDVWVNRLTRREIFDLANPIKRRRRPVDIDCLVDEACADLGISRFLRAVSEFLVETFELKTGTQRFIKLTEANARTALKATCALPGVARPIEMDGGIYVDGGAFSQLPVVEAYSRGHRKLLVICNKPRGFVPPTYKAWQRTVFFPTSRHGRQALLERTCKYRQATEFLAYPPKDANIFELHPPQMMCDLLERNRDTVARVWDAGFEHGVRDSANFKGWVATN